MSSWMNGAGYLDSNSGGPMVDPSTFMNNPASFDPSQFQNQQLHQRMQNGAPRNGSPSFNQPAYQTNPLIPSKRPRPREDSLGGSPRQAPNVLPNSRSQTPQQAPYPGFPVNSTPQPQQHGGQQPYSHLQNGSANASPSPIMANQLRPGGVPQRVSTTSPHPFSPAAQQFPHASPSQSEHSGRVDTPQSNNPYVQNPGFAPGFNSNFTPPPGRTSAPPQNAMSTPQMPQPHLQQSQMYAQQQAQQQSRGNTQSLEQQKLLYQMQLQQQMQQQNLMRAQRGNMPPNVNPMAKQMPGQNGMFPGGVRPQQPPQPRSGLTPENFMKSLATFMQQKNLPLDPNPIVGDRPVSLVNLYMTVIKLGGYKRVTSQNGWSSVAQALQFHPMQTPNAAGQLKGHYERNLGMFEEAWAANQQRQKMMQNQNAGGPGPQMSPTKQMNSQAAMQQPQQFMQQQQQALMAQHHQLQQQQMQSTPVKQMTQMHPQHQAVNGFSTPQQPTGPPHLMGPQGHARNSLSRTMEATTPQNGSAFTMPSPISASKPGSLSMQSPSVDVALRGNDKNHGPIDLPEEYRHKKRVLDTHGGIELVSLQQLGEQRDRARIDYPIFQQLGLIDIDALTRSLQCGIHAEVRLALDTLLLLSLDQHLPTPMDLRACEDLVETLVDCAENQVDFLAEHAAEVSDVMLVNSYEDVVRSCRSDQENLQDVPVYGSLEYDLDRAVEKLICITTIMRNLSFHEPNKASLAEDFVVKFLCVVIRYLGTRNMLLRTNLNTLDFMKDMILTLSNLAQSIELPGREQALCLLHFLLAFAPCPPPNNAGSDQVTFTPYDPGVHRYLYTAVDSLAKLLARDEPNRTLYKTIFASDSASSPPFDLLTRAFGLAISAVPDDNKDRKRATQTGTPLTPVVEARKPLLMQGMLAAEILASLAPGYETGLADSWLTSTDGFAPNLCRFIISLCVDNTPQMPHRGQPPAPKGVDDIDTLQIIQGGVNVLLRLAEKSRNPEESMASMSFTGWPSKERLLGALSLAQPQLRGILKQFCAYAGLGT